MDSILVKKVSTWLQQGAIMLSPRRYFTGVSSFKFQFRRLYQFSVIFETDKSMDYEEIQPYFLKLQSNPTVYQQEISKLSSYYKNLSAEKLSDSYRLNNALLFFALFCKKIQPNLIEAAQVHSEDIDPVILRMMGQKLLRLNQWPVAEKIIKEKFKGAREGGEETLKFEVYALNGNYRKMIEQLPHLAKSEIPQEVYYLLLNLLNYKDGHEIADIIKANPDFYYEMWHGILQLAMKGKLLSKKPTSFEVFLRQAEALSSRLVLNHSLLVLAFKKCEGIDQIQALSSDQVKQLKLILKEMCQQQLIALENNLKSFEKKLPEGITSTLLEAICQKPFNNDEIARSSLLCWIIKYRPDNYSFDMLMTDFSQAIDENVANIALESMGLKNEKAMKFIEFCLMEKDISIDKVTLKEAVDIASENFNYEPSDEFMKSIHRKGYNLSSKFYLRRLKQIIQCDFPNSHRAFECFKLISADSLHGELLQEYLRLSQDLLDLMVQSSNLDKCYKIYSTISKYQILKSLDRPKSFNDFVLENFSNGKFKQSFKTTINMECIKAVLDSIQQQQKQKQLHPYFMLSENFCVVALTAALSNFDFPIANRLRVYMNNCGYSDGGITFSQNVLKHWLRKL